MAGSAPERELRGVVVLGMDRSGTSAITRMFHRSGYFVGEQADLMAADDGNPTGYFENWRVYRANEQVLGQFDSTWFDAPGHSGQLALSADSTQPLREVLVYLLSAAGVAPLALKDPRVGKLMLLWWPLLEGVLHPVMAVRHPLEIALSLERRDGTAIPVALAMWELHWTRVLGCLDGQRVTVVPYAQILEAPNLASTLVDGASAGLRDELKHNVDSAVAGSAIEPHMRRSRVEASGGTRWLSENQRRLWELLDSLSLGTTLMRVPPWVGDPGEEVRTLIGYEHHRVHQRFEMGARIEQAARDLAERDLRLEEQNRQLAARDGSLTEALQRVSLLKAEIDNVRDRYRAIEERLRTAEHWLTVTTMSRSWRVAESLRLLKRRLDPRARLRGALRADPPR